LQEAVLKNYFMVERKSRLLSLKALMASAINTPEAAKQADEFLRGVQNALFPELIPVREDFSKDSTSKMETWRTKVIEISGDTATLRDTEEAAEEIMEDVDERLRFAQTRRRSRQPGWRGR
jgi:hypothetical protein